MVFTGTVITVDDIVLSRKFYEEVLGQKVILDFGANIAFEGGASLLEKGTWCEFINKDAKQIISLSNSFELYFEEDNFDDFMQRMKEYQGIEYVHETKEFPWGQRVIRFYDPDHHIIEVGESMKTVIRKFIKMGLSVEETVERTQHPIEFVESCLENSYISEFCTTYYRPEINVLYLKWKKFCCGDDYRNPLYYVIDTFMQQKCATGLFNVANGFEDKEEDIQWAFNEFIPKMASTSCKNIIFVMGLENKIEGEIDAFTAEFMKYFKVYKCITIDEAKDLIKTL